MGTKILPVGGALAQNLELTALNASLEEKVRGRAAALQEAKDMIEQSLRSVVVLLSDITEKHASGLRAHSGRVAKCSRCLAEAMGEPPENAARIETAALLHDIGHMSTPARLLEPGMILAKDVVNVRDVPLVKAGAVLDAGLIIGLSRNEEVEPVVTRVYVTRCSVPEAPEVQALVSLPASQAKGEIGQERHPPGQERHDHADSHQALGSIRVPRCPGNHQAPTGRQLSGEAIMTHRKRILCIDDERNILQAILRILHSRPHAIFLAENGERALEMARGMHPHLIILDLMMPGLDGYAVIDGLRAMGLRDLPVVMLTGMSAAEDILGGYRQGATYYITKPFEPERLLNIVDYLLGEMSESEREALEPKL
jgi:response regulator RpfG family c-di-GMP phosphodiesterase